jgi:hypothetical protein
MRHGSQEAPIAGKPEEIAESSLYQRAMTDNESDEIVDGLSSTGPLPARTAIEPSPDAHNDAVPSEDFLAAIHEPATSMTSRAGLLFLLPVMERLELPQWIKDHFDVAASGFPVQLLRRIALRLNTPPNDPILASLGEYEIESPASEEAISLWLARLRAYCRRIVRIGFHSLVCRKGRVLATATHLDVYFPASDADIRIRRAGLDIDPGWLPWFGRVVHFHYLLRWANRNEFS